VGEEDTVYFRLHCRVCDRAEPIPKRIVTMQEFGG
jgi:hypothetical protein